MTSQLSWKQNHSAQFLTFLIVKGRTLDWRLLTHPWCVPAPVGGACPRRDVSCVRYQVLPYRMLGVRCEVWGVSSCPVTGRLAQDRTGAAQAVSRHTSTPARLGTHILYIYHIFHILYSKINIIKYWLFSPYDSSHFTWINFLCSINKFYILYFTCYILHISTIIYLHY